MNSIFAEYTKEGHITFPLRYLLEAMPAEHKTEMAQDIACDSHVIKFVTDQLVDRWTEQGWSGASLCTASPDPTPEMALDHGWRRIAKASGDIAKREIERLERALKSTQDELQRLRQEQADARHAIH